MTAASPAHWHNKTVLITGAASGIGLALTTELLRRGARVWMGDINPAIVERHKELPQTLQEQATPVQLDVTDVSQLETVMQEILEQGGQLDYLFNNAGIGYGCDSVQLSPAHYDRYIDINIRGVTNGVALAYPIMARQGFGTIVNTASVGGLIPSSLMSPYAMTKHAVVGLTTSLREEGRFKGVNFITLCPGSVNTPIFDSEAPADFGRIRSTRLREFTREKDTSISPDEFARKALDDVEKNRAIIIYPKLFRLIVWIYKLCPPLYRWMTRPNLAREMQRLNSPHP